MKRKQNKNKERGYKAKYIAVFFGVIFVAGLFFFGGKIKGYAEGKLMAKGNFYFNGGAYDLDKAAKYFKLAAFVGGKVSYPHYQLARVLFVKGDYDGGLKEIDRALVLNPENKRAFYIRGLIDGYAGNLDAAVDDFQKFVAWAPKEWAGHNDLAWVYYQKKDYQNAANAAQKGLEAVPNNAWLLNGLGVSLEALGRNEEAKAALDQAQALAKNLTANDWKRAYPGNNAESAPWDLAQFKTDVEKNIELASSKKNSSKRGEFQAACSSVAYHVCSGTSCDTTYCDPDHPPGPGECSYLLQGVDPAAFGGGRHVCSDNCDCGAQSSTWTPDPSTVCAGQVFTQEGVECGGERAATGTKVCAGNRAPIVSISKPANGTTGLGQMVEFITAFPDPDGDTPLWIHSVMTCNGSVVDEQQGDVYGNNLPPFTTGPFPLGVNCSWSVTADDKKGGVGSAVSNFSIANGALPSCACGGLRSFCTGRVITDSDLCALGSPDPAAVNINPASAVTVTWTCGGAGCSGTASCSATGRKYCGWIETNP